MPSLNYCIIIKTHETASGKGKKSFYGPKELHMFPADNTLFSKRHLRTFLTPPSCRFNKNHSLNFAAALNEIKKCNAIRFLIIILEQLQLRLETFLRAPQKLSKALNSHPSRLNTIKFRFSAAKSFSSFSPAFCFYSSAERYIQARSHSDNNDFCFARYSRKH